MFELNQVTSLYFLYKILGKTGCGSRLSFHQFENKINANVCNLSK